MENHTNPFLLVRQGWRAAPLLALSNCPIGTSSQGRGFRLIVSQESDIKRYANKDHRCLGLDGMGASSMFKIGDLAVYPAHGVGRIESIEKRDISGEKKDFYIMKILDNNMIIMIPIDNVQSVGLRDIIDVGEVAKVYEIMKKRDMPVDNQTWNRRYREYMEKIKTGSVYEVAEVLRDLYLLKVDKDLSFGERKMLDTAQTLLLKELSIAKKTDEGAIMSDINSIFDLE